MTEADWLAGVHPQIMLAWLLDGSSEETVGRSYGRHLLATDRKLRLFVCACVRSMWDHIPDWRSRRAVKVAEQFADGEVTHSETFKAYEEARVVYGWHASFAASTLATSAVGLADEFVRRAGTGKGALVASAILRDIIGNPWRPVALDRPCERCNGTGSLTSRSGVAGAASNTCFACEAGRVSTGEWLTPAVLSIAQECYDTRDFRSLPIAADALTDAGCDNEDLLEHLRSPGPHARGCWAVDLILGNS